MEDKYGNMAELFAASREGRDYRIHRREAKSNFAIIAPHGGVLEPGTYEIADAIAATRHTFYCFEALTEGLHVTSHHFDDPACLRLVKQSDYVVTVHGCHDSKASNGPDRTVAIGGLDTSFGAVIRQELEQSGIAIGHRPELAGVHPLNICNRGSRGMGVQLELTRSLRDKLMATRSAGTGGLFAGFAAALDRAVATVPRRS